MDVYYTVQGAVSMVVLVVHMDRVVLKRRVKKAQIVFVHSVTVH